MKPVFLLISAFCLACAISRPAFSAQPATTDTVFNKRFIHSLQPRMGYDRLVARIGTPGARLGERQGNTPSTTVTRYGWKGGKHSSLEVDIVAGRLSQANMRAPNGHTYLFDARGAISER